MAYSDVYLPFKRAMPFPDTESFPVLQLRKQMLMKISYLPNVPRGNHSVIYCSNM